MGKSRHQRDYDDQEIKILREKERQQERQRKFNREDLGNDVSTVKETNADLHIHS